MLPGLFAKYGVASAGTVDFQYNAFDLSPQVSKPAQTKPDVVGLGAPPEAAVNLAKEAKRQGLATRFVGGTTIADPDLPRRMDGAGEGMTIGTTFFQNLDDRTKAFAKAFAEKAAAAGIARHEPNQQDAATYDIVYLIAEAAHRAKATGAPDKLATERTQVRDALAALKDVDALEGRISFGPDRDAIKPIYVIEARKGEWALLDTRKAD